MVIALPTKLVIPKNILGDNNWTVDAEINTRGWKKKVWFHWEKDIPSVRLVFQE